MSVILFPHSLQTTGWSLIDDKQMWLLMHLQARPRCHLPTIHFVIPDCINTIIIDEML